MNPHTMRKSAVVISVAVLASIRVCMFPFTCWWFPRRFKKANAMDMTEFRANRAQMEAAASGLSGQPGRDGEEREDVPPAGSPPRSENVYLPSVTPFLMPMGPYWLPSQDYMLFSTADDLTALMALNSQHGVQKSSSIKQLGGHLRETQ